MTTYLIFDLEHKDLNFDGLEKYKKSKGCRYFKLNDDIDLNALGKIIQDSITIIKKCKAK